MSSSQSADVVLDGMTQLLHRQIGLRPDPTLRGRLRRCIRDAAAAHNQSLEAYLVRVREQPDALQELVNRVTVQETAFFRHVEHFDLLARDILPSLATPVTIWSAACANGQEAYSLAMVLDEQGIDGSVIASDLSTAALERTRAARYNVREVTGLSPERIARHLTRVGPDWEVNRSIRDRVTILPHNLLDAVPRQVHACQVVFCRNVLIYLTPEHARTFLDRLAAAAPAASLFVGSAETIWSVSDRFEAAQGAGTYYYRLRAKPAPVEKALPQPRRASRPAPRREPSQPAPPAGPAVSIDDATTLEQLTLAGQGSTAEGDPQSAVVAFRKCAYLAPEDPMNHLHLALALDAVGDRTSAHRAYAAARQALLASDPTLVHLATEGYTTADLLRLLDTKLQVIAP